MVSDTSYLRNYLEKEEFRQVADARRSFWSGGFAGFAFGSLTGLAAYRLNPFITKLPLTRNHAFMMFLAGGGFGMFAGSYLGATRRRQDIHNVLRRHMVCRMDVVKAIDNIVVAFFSCFVLFTPPRHKTKMSKRSSD